MSSSRSRFRHAQLGEQTLRVVTSLLERQHQALAHSESTYDELLLGRLAKGGRATRGGESSACRCEEEQSLAHKIKVVPGAQLLPLALDPEAHMNEGDKEANLRR